MIRWLSVALGLLMALTSDASNEDTSVVLHADFSGEGIDCALVEQTCDTSQPVTEVQPGEGPFFLYVMLRNYDEVCGANFQLSLEGGIGEGYWGDWVLLVAIPVCGNNQVASSLPSPDDGEVVISFEPITGGGSAVLFFCSLLAGSSGCIVVGENQAGFVSVLDCDAGVYTRIAETNRGRVCVGEGGYGACDPVVPVESGTWGRIKAQYVGDVGPGSALMTSP